MSNGLDQEQDRHFVSPDLDPNCLQSYKQTKKSPLAGKEILTFHKQIGGGILAQHFTGIFSLVLVVTILDLQATLVAIFQELILSTRS